MGCGSSILNTTTAGERVPDEPSQTLNLNNNDSGDDSTIPMKNALGKQDYGASRETTEADRRAADVQKEMHVHDVVETKTAPKSRDLTIVHFNDVYNIEPREKEPVGGAARFATKLASFRHLNPLTVFSGDCLNPSSMSSVTGGKQMIPILNALNVNIAVFGNHDFDFGVDELMEFSAATTFPWLLSNVIDNMTGQQLAGGEVKQIIEWDGRKIGFIGLVEEEWLVTLATVDREEVTYLDFVTEGTKLAKELREEGAEFVVALTHMRGPNDCRLAEQAAGIDLILGGHDHDYFAQKINGVQVLKSGTDFREFSHITVSFNGNNTFSLNIQKIEITSDIPEDPEVKATVDKFVGVMNEMMEETIGELEVELDGRFASIRRKETNLGNFVTDIILNVTEVDCVILNSGTLRSDTIHPPGKFKMKDLSAILPMPDVLVVLELSGDQILEALENGVSQWPKLEGRFPQVAGMKFSFNPKCDPGNRVLVNSVRVNDEPLQNNKKYKVCTKSYIARGKDGYQVFTKAKVLVDEEDGPILSAIVRNHFHSINIVRGVTKSKSSHRQSLIMKSKECLNSGQEVKENGCHDATQHAKWRHRSSNMIDGGQGSSLDIFLNLEKEHSSISPKVEGRITIVDEEDEATRLANSKSEEDVAVNVVQVQPTVTSNVSKLGPDLATEDEYWDLWEAVKVDDIDVVKNLRKDKNIRFSRFQDNKTILHLGAERNSSRVVAYLLTEGRVDPNVKDEILQGVPLHGAAEYGSVNAARVLLEHGAEINKQDLIGNTALHIACEHDQGEMKTFLVNQGADTTVVNSDGETPAL